MLTKKEAALLKEISQAHHVKELMLYRTATTESFGPDSKVELAVSFQSLRPLQYGENYLSLQLAIEDALGRKSDLVDLSFVKNDILLRLIKKTKHVLHVH